MTTTVNACFGSKILSPSTGIVLNNEMDDFSMPRNVSKDVPPPAPANFIVPGKRPLSSMSPTIALKDGKLKAVVGASGGAYIIGGTSEHTTGLPLHIPSLHSDSRQGEHKSRCTFYHVQCSVFIPAIHAHLCSFYNIQLTPLFKQHPEAAYTLAYLFSSICQLAQQTFKEALGDGIWQSFINEGKKSSVDAATSTLQLKDLYHDFESNGHQVAVPCDKVTVHFNLARLLEQLNESGTASILYCLILFKVCP
ncbi:hypothetical protein VNO80_26772 [Phaseolus coccineus]|uniref:Uncharacterized protein n=1 Tax=Phaseolus coccineus TaxID=3886 RepID=A0AAN9LKF8_PHACN